MKRIAIIQSCYVPWRGFFDLIARCDEYVIYDQVAFSKGHWHNRNRIKTSAGLRWLTIPVSTSDRLGQPMEQVEVKEGWAEAHMLQIEQAYAKAPMRASFMPTLRAQYERAGAERLLTDINEIFLRWLVELLDIGVTITRDRDYALTGTRSERVLSTCVAAGATHYVSGPSAKSYLDEEKFKAAGITVEWMEYGPYPNYPQLHDGPFEGQVSILDALLNGQADMLRNTLGLADLHGVAGAARELVSSPK